jgi:hypothetical protein
MNTVIGGDVGSIYSIVADADAGSGLSLDFINDYMSLLGFFLFTSSSGFLMVPSY